MTKDTILQYFKDYAQNHISDNDINKNGKKILRKIQSASESDILLGECPKYFRAYMECNSTGVGTSSFEGSKTRRTVALDYVTDEYLFIDGHEGAGVKGLQIFLLNPGETVRYYLKESIKDVAKNYGLNLHLQQFGDLNILFQSHRLNRYNVKITEGPFSCQIQPIFLSLINKDKPILIGYVYTKSGNECIIVDFNDINSAKKTSVFSLWMLLGFVFPPIFIIALIVIIYRLAPE